MGCSSSKATISVADIQSMLVKDVLNQEREVTLGDGEIQQDDPEGWPYDLGRLAVIDYEDVIMDREPWTDPNFPPDASSLFINGKSHQQADVFPKKKKWEIYTWERIADTLPPGKKVHMFDSIEPEDVKMGNLKNCNFMASLSGLAERDVMAETGKSNPGKTIRDMFLTQKINKAGCYAIELIIDGVKRVVVIDDYVPVKIGKTGKLKLAFSRPNRGQNEIWMMLIEKAYAKVLGSYEAMEHSDALQSFQILGGGPSEVFLTKHFRQDINRGDYKNERMDKFWKLIEEANKRGWVMTVTSPKLPQELIDLHGLDQCRWVTIDNKGISYESTYTVLDGKIVKLENDWTDIIAQLRNPTGKASMGLQWTGDWGPEDNLWTKKTKQQVGLIQSKQTEAMFWMSLEDLIIQFEKITVNYCDPTYSRWVVNADLEGDARLSLDAAAGAEEAKEANKPRVSLAGDWGIIQFKTKYHSPNGFWRLFQLDRRFYDIPDSTETFLDYDHARLTMIVVKKVTVPPRQGQLECGVEYVFLEGKEAVDQSVGVKIDRIKSGEYLVIYRTNFSHEHKCRKLNLVFSGSRDVVKTCKIKRVKPSSFKPSFFSTMLRNLHSRQYMEGHFSQPFV